MVDGKLLQTDKKYSALKMKQKEKIALWLNEEILSYYREHGAWPTKDNEYRIVLEKLYTRIESAGIWIPYDEIHRRFMGKRNTRIGKVQSALAKSERNTTGMKLKNYLLVVVDMEASKQFYKELFGMQVIRDFEDNVILSGGIVLQELKSWMELTNHQVTIGNGSEFFFETSDFDSFLQKVRDKDIPIYSDVRENSWGKRAIQILDPTDHIIEVAEC